jgi:hypothetical protein
MRGSLSDLDDFFAQYAERYMASDVDAISAVYEAPLLALPKGRAIRFSDRAAVREHLQEVMAAYSRSGAARADIATLDVVDMGKSSVFCHSPVAREGYRRRALEGLPNHLPFSARRGRLANPLVHEPRRLIVESRVITLLTPRGRISIREAVISPRLWTSSGSRTADPAAGGQNRDWVSPVYPRARVTELGRAASRLADRCSRYAGPDWGLGATR